MFKKKTKQIKQSKVSNNKVIRILKKPLGVVFAIGRYFKGSWTELRQVRWPDRKGTWSLTAAVLLFTGFFFVLILLLDAGFKQLFELIIK